MITAIGWLIDELQVDQIGPFGFDHPGPSLCVNNRAILRFYPIETPRTKKLVLDVFLLVIKTYT